jgi:hypothetical protein
MTVRRISKPPIIAPERALRSEASKFHDQIQLAKKTAKEPRFATVSADGGGRNLGLPSLYLGDNSAMRQSWSFAPVHHDVAADVETQNRPADVDQGPVVQDGWERAITDEQLRQAETAAAEATAAADAELDEALAEFEAGLEEFKQEWAEDHGASVGSDGTLLLPAEQFDALAAEWEEDFQGWWDAHLEELNAPYANYGEAVAQELRQAALEAERQGEDPNQAVSEQADEIQERDTNGDWSADGSWQADEQDQTAVDAIDAAEQQVLGETQAVREAQLDYAKEGQELESAENLPDNLADKSEDVTAAEAEFDEAAATLEAAVAEQMEDLGQEVLIELAEQLGVTAPNANYRPGELQTLADLSDEQLLELIQDALGKLNDPESLDGVLDTLDEGFRNELAAALGVEPDELGAVLGDPGQLAEALGAEDEQAAIDALADQLIGMAAGEVSEAHGNNAYIDNLLFGSDDSPGAEDQVAVDLRVGELGRIIEEIDPDELSGVEKELWEAGDQVSVALLRQLGVSFIETQDVRPEGGGLAYGTECVYAIVDGERIRLSGAEEELLDEDPAALALFLKSGFRLEGGSGSSISLAFDGVSYATVEEQIGSLERPELEELAEQLGVTAPNAYHYRPGELPQTLADLSDEDLRALVLDHLEDSDDLPDSLNLTLDDLGQKLVDEGRLSAQDQQAFAGWLEESLAQAKGNPDVLAAIAGALWWYGNDAESLAADAAAAGALRLQQTGEQVSALMAEAKEDEAQRILTANMDAALSEEERAILWQQVGLQHFGQDYWEAELDGLIADYEDKSSFAGDLGDWFQGIEDDISPEMAHIILGVVEDKVDVDKFDLYDGAFFNGLSAIVTVADQRPDPTRSTTWAESMAEWLLQPMESHPYGYQLA